MIIALLVVGSLWAEPAGPTAPKVGGTAQPTPTYAAPKAADAKPDQLVCRTEAVLGSRLPVRRCRTVADINDRQLQDRQQIEHAQIVQEPSK